MLVLTRKKGEGIMIDKNVCVTILSNKDGQVEVGVSAPRSIPVHRTEVFLKLHGGDMEQVIQNCK